MFEWWRKTTKPAKKIVVNFIKTEFSIVNIYITTEAAASIDDKETYFVKNKANAKTAIPRRIDSGFNAIITPALVATLLPPLNPAKIE